MINDDWRKKINAELAKAVPDISDFLAVARKLIDWHNLVLGGPRSLLSALQSVHEDVLEKEKSDWITAIYDGVLSERLRWTAGDKEVAAQLCGLTRAWDDLLMIEANSGRFERNSIELLVGDYWVVPRKSRPRSLMPKRKDGYRRRGVVRHCLLPRVINGLEVQPVFMETISENASKPRDAFGAAFFPDFALGVSYVTGEKFYATHTIHNDAFHDVEWQLGASVRDRCFAIVWPELTMPPELRTHVQDLLKSSATSVNPVTYPDIVVAGSWHEECDGGRRNVARVYNGFGREQSSYDKVVIYFDDEVGDEDIQPGKTLPVLVTDSHIVALAICKDYCDLSSPSPYENLPVDAILVPSMGGVRVAAAHSSAAVLTRNRSGARAFVVQQVFSTADQDIVAFVLPPNANQGADLLEMKSGENWRSFNGL